jgi:hypothetical protein
MHKADALGEAAATSLVFAVPFVGVFWSNQTPESS